MTKRVTFSQPDEWLTVAKGVLRFEAYALGGGLMRWRVRPVTGWRRFMPTPWTTGIVSDCDMAHWRFVKGTPP